MLLVRQPHITLIAAVSHPSEVGPLVEGGQPMTILVDTTGSQVEMAQQLQAAAPDGGLLFLVDTYDLSEVVSLLRAGASGCISRDAEVSELARAIIAVGRGEIALPPTMASHALAALARGRLAEDASDLVEDLTERETEVLRLLAGGMTNKEIAQTLILSVRTIEAHLRSIYGKLNVSSRTEAALWAVRNGFGPED